ncbi:MAG: hypothetical protein ACFB3T_15585 [Geminicoccaceae bacterium]
MGALETAIGKRLINRTTRGCTLTEAGQDVFTAAERLEQAMLGVASSLQGRQDRVMGTVRIDALAVFCRRRL